MSKLKWCQHVDFLSIQCKFEWDGDKLVMTQAPVDPEHPMKAQRIVREIVEGEMKQVSFQNDIVNLFMSKPLT